MLNVLPPLPPRALWTRQAPLPFPFSDPRCRVHDLGRNALWHGLRSLGLGEGDELLMPAYHCGTEVGPVVDLGIVPRFWAGTADLEPDAAELERLLGPRTRALYLIHHLGFAQDAPRWRRWCDERGLMLMEDVAPAWPGLLGGRPLGSWGDLSIYSPWKMLGLPEGAAVLCDPPPAAIPPRDDAPLKGLLKGFARWPAQRLPFAARLPRRRSGRLFDPATDFGVRDPQRGISKAGLALMRRLWRPGFADSRRDNYEWLLARIGERVPAPFDRAPGEGCPLEIPIAVDDKRGLMRHLTRRGAGGVDFWSVPHPATPAGAFPDIERRRATTVVLPVHQGLRRADRERIARAVGEWPTGS
jgi:dTDP-4-amino-4,6-dideoxygalactose transaminase